MVFFNDNKPIKKIENPFDEDNYIKDLRQKNEGDYKWVANVVIYKRVFQDSEQNSAQNDMNNHQYLLI